MEINKAVKQSSRKSERLRSCRKKEPLFSKKTPDRKRNNKLKVEDSPSCKQTTLDSFVKKRDNSFERNKSPDSMVQKYSTNVRHSPIKHESSVDDITKQAMKRQKKKTGKEPVNKILNDSRNQQMLEPSKQSLIDAARRSMRETTLKARRHTFKRSLSEQSNNNVKETSKQAMDQPSRNERKKSAQRIIKDKLKTKETDSVYRSPSKKFDKLVPKVEDILRSMEEEKKFKQIQELINETSEKFFNNLIEKKDDRNETNKEKKVYDCKHLSQKELERRFHANVEFLDDIFHGKVYNERHELFKQDSLLNHFTDNDLRVNETTSAFTSEQLIYIVSLFRQKYDNGNIYKYSDYYFKVLLPEFCLKIFMDYHYKFGNKDVAMEYLKSLPVPKII